ncbi:hypothetical protein FACS189476_11620 [Spirochaetia bacterium]|nr:hypothetical protein FACS189476_11620 [Spirochaetia bacterium]
MKKIVAVFLLFVSFNLFAEKHEIGRLIVEIRDYGITSRLYKYSNYLTLGSECRINYTA